MTKLPLSTSDRLAVLNMDVAAFMQSVDLPVMTIE
jgi:hypothetical protein